MLGELMLFMIDEKACLADAFAPVRASSPRFKIGIHIRSA